MKEVKGTYYAHRLRRKLGRGDFVKYFEGSVAKCIERFKMFKKGDVVLVAVSGGKDSLALLYSLHSLRQELGIEVKALTLDLGIPSYSDEAVSSVRRHCEALGVDYVVVSLKEEYGFSLPEAAKVGRLRRPICSLCGVIKRYVMNKVGVELGADVVATGHNLNDLTQFIMLSLFSGRLEDLLKLTPYSPGVKGLLTAKAKPLALLYEDEDLSYVKALGLNYVRGPCPYRPKAGLQLAIREALDQLERKEPCSLYNFALSAVKRLIPSLNVTSEDLRRCKVCGMPSKGEVCSFCRIRERIGLNRSLSQD